MSNPSGQPQRCAAAASGQVPVVGLGASAGGLEALVEFLAQVEPGSGLAFAVVHHLATTRKSLLPLLLQRETRIPVGEATDRTPVEPDRVYVIPPDAVMTLVGGRLLVGMPRQPRALRLPIDQLFVSLAQAQGAQAIGVVLSGVGSDGTAGLRAIRSAGGLTLAQAPGSARFDAMPRSAIAAGSVDIVAPPGDLMARLLDEVARRQATGKRPVPATDARADMPALPGSGPGAAGGDGGLATRAAEAEDETGAAAAGRTASLESILVLLRDRGRHDFLLYKHSTLLRRIERRMSIHRMPAWREYEEMLRANPQELDLLVNELLIGVTGFFRDRPVWRSVADLALEPLLRGRSTACHLRAWVAGCSTGEEAYTLAIVFLEQCATLPQHARSTLQIFATDLSKDAIAIARGGLYPASISGEVSPDRLARFFVPEDGGWRIHKAVREMVVFAAHDVVADPPFTRLDLLSCRNLPIYLTAPLQRRLMSVFHYSLQPGGILLLGGSEAVGRFDNLFEPLDAAQRLYRRRDTGQPVDVQDFPLRSPPPPARQEPALPEDAPPPSSLQTAAERVLLERFSPPAVLVNDRGDIVYIHGRTGRFLEPAAGKANWNIHVMAREGLRAALGAALRQATGQAEPVELRGLALGGDAGRERVDVTVAALRAVPELAGLLIVVFRDAPPAARRRRDGTGETQVTIEAELRRAHEAAQALREETRASQEELLASNEQLQSANEELQSTNEELTSSKEEMQSMNEELQAVNAELSSRLDQLALAQSDVRNLLNSTDIATLFLDKDLNVRRFTEKARRIISLRDGDIGRPLAELATLLDYPQLKDDVQDMLRTMIIAEREIRSQSGEWYAVRVMPYRTQENVIQGAVITFVDITAAKALEARLRGGDGPPPTDASSN